MLGPDLCLGASHLAIYSRNLSLCFVLHILIADVICGCSSCTHLIILMHGMSTSANTMCNDRPHATTEPSCFPPSLSATQSAALAIAM